MRKFIQIWDGFENAVARLNTRWGNLASQVFRWGIPIALLAFLAYSLTHIGWLHVWSARPSSLGFYLVLLLPFFVQPFADLIIYRNLLGVGRSLPLYVLLRKRYMNSIMLDYSGEAYFFFWVKKNLNLQKGILLHAVKDTNVLSAGAGLAIIWLMLLALVADGVMKMPPFLSSHSWMIVSIGSLPLVLCLALIIGGRRVTALSRSSVLTTFSIHLARSITALAIEFALWWLSGALPSTTVCLEFVALRLLVTRLPLVPNKELIFVGVGIAAAGLLNVSTPRWRPYWSLWRPSACSRNSRWLDCRGCSSNFQVRRSAGEPAP